MLTPNSASTAVDAATSPATQGRGSPESSIGFLAGFDASDAATIIAAVLAATIAALIAVVGYSIQSRVTRRSERADLYGNAIGAVEAYLEGPYRIRRKTKDLNNWFEISSALSDAKTNISHHEALLQMHAPIQVADAYSAFAGAAIREAGPQMTTAWATPSLDKSTDVPLGTGYDRTDSDLKRRDLVEEMSRDLASITAWWRPLR